jgi:hypothetical protein
MRSRISPFSLVALLAVSSLLVPEAVCQRKPAAQTPAGRPVVARDLFEIQTVPAGLTIYVGVDTSTTKPDSGWVQIVSPHPLLTAAQRRGTTPLTLKDIKPGRYLIGVSEVPLLNRDFQPMGYSDPILPLAAIAPSHPLTNVMPGRRLDAPVVGAYVYRFTVTESGPRRLIILSKPDLTLSTLDSLYPKKAAFSFDTVAFEAEWQRKTAGSVSPTDTRLVIGLLRRGGKCMVVKGDLRYAAQVLEDHTWQISIEIRKVSDAERP